MAITYSNTPPKWGNDGVKPTDEKTSAGYEVNDTLPADYLNFHLHSAGECIEELQTKLSNEDTERKKADTALQTAIDNEVAARKEAVAGISKEQLGLDKVDNTPDSEKAVAFASEAGVGRKVEYPLTVRFKGGSTEGTDMWTYDGSTSRSINITSEKIGAAKNDLSNVDDTVFKEKVESTVTTGKPLVAAISTDGGTYTSTVDGITELYNGLEITIIPNMTSTKAAVQFNLNGLGAKNLRLKIDGYNNGNSGTMAAFAGWLGQDCPLTIRYIAKFDNWQTVDFSRQSTNGLYGSLSDTYRVTVPNSWVEDTTNGGYTQTITVEDILEDDTPIVDVVLGSNVATNKTYLKAWACISRITTADGSITLYAYDEAPTVAFNIQLKVVR